MRALAAALCLFALVGMTGCDGNKATVLVMEKIQLQEDVPGDLVIFGGEVRLAPGVRVRGDVLVLMGGSFLGDPSAVDGRVFHFRSLAGLELAGAPQRLEQGIRVLTVGLWGVLVLAASLLFPRSSLPLGNRLGMRELLGLMASGAATMAAAITAGITLASAGMTVPLVVATLFMALLAWKVLGLAAFSVQLASTVLKGWLVHRNLRVAAVLAPMLAIRFIPKVGPILWYALGLLFMGSAWRATSTVLGKHKRVLETPDQSQAWPR